jgi:hypothetical protein
VHFYKPPVLAGGFLFLRFDRTLKIFGVFFYEAGFLGSLLHISALTDISTTIGGILDCYRVCRKEARKTDIKIQILLQIDSNSSEKPRI